MLITIFFYLTITKKYFKNVIEYDAKKLINTVLNKYKRSRKLKNVCMGSNSLILLRYFCIVHVACK